MNKKIDFTLFKPAYWNAKPNVGDPRWCYDTEVKAGLLDWEDLVDLLVGSHEVTEVKELANMFNGCAWRNQSDPLVILKHTKYQRAFVSKCAHNVVSTSLLILDYDSGITIDTVREQLKQWNHIGYTSHSHTPEKHKFRVLIPLTENIPVQLMKKIKDSELSILPALVNVFGGIDLTTFDLARSFFMPTCPATNIGNAKSWSNIGVDFDWTVLPVTTTVKRVVSSTIDNTKTDLLELFRNNGLYQGPLGGNKHQVTCPWHGSHSSDVNNGAVVWEFQGFCCKHNSCINKSFRNLMTYFEVNSINNKIYEEEQKVDVLQERLKQLKLKKSQGV
jgi:hypothetical protein